MQRARSFIKATLKGSKKKSAEMIQNIEGLIHEHVRNIQQELKGEK